MNAQQLTDQSLAHGDRRSPVYRAGMLATFTRKLGGAPVHCTYPAGSVEFDAFFSGAHRAADEWAWMQLQEQQA